VYGLPNHHYSDGAVMAYGLPNHHYPDGALPRLGSTAYLTCTFACGYHVLGANYRGDGAH
jgi:hypothetical protein